MSSGELITSHISTGVLSFLITLPSHQMTLSCTQMHHLPLDLGPFITTPGSKALGHQHSQHYQLITRSYLQYGLHV